MDQAHFFKGVEGAALVVDVVLVDLVREDEELLLVGEPDDVLDVLLAEDLPRGVARVDDHEGANGGAVVSVHKERRCNDERYKQVQFRMMAPKSRLCTNQKC